MKNKFLVFLFLLAIAIGGFSVLAGTSLAAMPTKMIGWGWASNTGWIDFGTTTGTAPRYITVNQYTGGLTGFAWSSNLGWLRFEPLYAGPSVLGNDTAYGAKVAAVPGSNNLSTVKGWLRACSVFLNPNLCSGTLRPASELGGWDGWIKMQNVTYNSATSRYDGYAWGALVGGWLDLSVNSGDVNNDCDPNVEDCEPCNPAVETCGSDSTTQATCKIISPVGTIRAGNTIVYEGTFTGTKPFGFIWRYDNSLGTPGTSNLSSVTVNKIATAGTHSMVFNATPIGGSNYAATCPNAVVEGACRLKVVYSPLPRPAGNTVKDGTFLFENDTWRENFYDCSDGGDVVTLTASKEDGITWGGCDSTSPANPSETCKVTVNGEKVVTANFGTAFELSFSPASVKIPDNLNASNWTTVTPADAQIVVDDWGSLADYVGPNSLEKVGDKMRIVLDTNNHERDGSIVHIIRLHGVLNGVSSETETFRVFDDQNVGR